MKNNRGFTILEMVIVLAIIGLIFLLTMPNIAQKQAEINNKECMVVVNKHILSVDFL